MKYRLVKKANPSDRTAPEKWYPNAVNTGTKTLSAICNNISGRSSLTRGDVQNVVCNFVDEIPSFLLDGYSVQLGDLGTLRLTLSGEGAESPDKFQAGTMMKNPKIVLTPGPLLKKALNDIHYEQE